MKLAIALFFAMVAGAQPHITVVSAADFAPGVNYGGLATIFGTSLSDAPHSASLPWPQQLGPTQVLACNLLYFSDVPCIPMQVTYASAGQINFYVPPSITFKSTEGATLPASPQVVFSVTVNGTPDTDYTAKRSTFVSLGTAPRIFFEGYGCFIDTRYQDADKNCGLSTTPKPTYAADLGAITDQQGHLLTSSNPARIGQYYTVWLTGITSGTGLAAQFTNVPVYGYSGDTNTPVNVTYVGPSGYPGLYQLNFLLDDKILGGGYPGGYPPRFPCGNYSWEISLDINAGLVLANLVQIPVVIQNGDAACQ